MIPERIFYLRVVLSFFIAGGWIAFSTVLAERFGSKKGGLISNLPSNILVSMIFISIVNDVDYVKSLAPAVPIGLTINALFITAFILLLRYGLFFAVTGSLMLWLLLAVILAGIELPDIITNIFICLATIVITVLFLEKIIKVSSQQNSIKKYSPGQIIFRTVFAGGIVATVVVISKYSSPWFTGLFSTFPAMLLSTLVILTINQSPEFAKATGKILILSLTNIIFYILLVSYTYPRAGILLGTLASYSLSVIWIALLYPLVRRMV